MPQVIDSALLDSSSYISTKYVHTYQCYLMHEGFVCMCVCDSVVCVCVYVGDV